MFVYGSSGEAIVVTDNWALTVWDGMKYAVTDIIIPAFNVLDSIPLGLGSASVLDLMFGIVVIGIAVSFFWRAGAATQGIASVKMRQDRAERRSFEPRSYSRSTWRNGKTSYTESTYQRLR